MTDFTMPSLGADMKTGKLIAWHVKPGDQLRRGEIIADVESAKGIMEIEVFEDCIIEELLLETNQEVPVGTAIAKIQTPSTKKEEVKRARISPLARKLAAETGVDLTQVKGTGAQGAISQRDLKAPVDSQTSMRQAIASAMSLANREIPHYYLETQIDMSYPLQWLERENQKRSLRERILPVILLLKATAKALNDVPQLNGYWIDGSLQLKESIHIGFAISLRQGGLVTPAIHHCDLKSLDELMANMRELIENTRSGRLRSSDLSDPTITLTNLGDIGVERVFGVIYPPQIALVGFGKITERPWAIGGMLGVRPIVSATVAGDHRASDGIVGAKFLQSLNAHLQVAEKL